VGVHLELDPRRHRYRIAGAEDGHTGGAEVPAPGDERVGASADSLQVAYLHEVTHLKRGKRNGVLAGNRLGVDHASVRLDSADLIDQRPGGNVFDLSPVFQALGGQHLGDQVHSLQAGPVRGHLDGGGVQDQHGVPARPEPGGAVLGNHPGCVEALFAGQTDPIRRPIGYRRCHARLQVPGNDGRHPAACGAGLAGFAQALEQLSLAAEHLRASRPHPLRLRDHLFGGRQVFPVDQQAEQSQARGQDAGEAPDDLVQQGSGPVELVPPEPQLDQALFPGAH
jgi:hypothetical protein